MSLGGQYVPLPHSMNHADSVDSSAADVDQIVQPNLNVKVSLFLLGSKASSNKVV